MFENKTFENIMSDCLSRVSGDVDKREGSIIYDALAPAIIELVNAYINLDIVLDESFAETASRAFLILRAKERGIEPYPATYALLKAKFNCEVSVGSRFNLESLNYVVTEFIEEIEGKGFYYKVRCETPGAVGNMLLGKMTPVEYIEGLTFAEIISIISYAEDEEDTEVFRRRYFDSLNMQAFGGNIADYKRIMRGMEGVGQVRVYTADEWNGGGTVNIVFSTPENTKASAELINQIQEAVDPIAFKGKGSGFAPIGHIVTVGTVREQKLDVNIKIKLEAGYTEKIITPILKTALENYFDSINNTWEESWEDSYIHEGQGMKIVVAMAAGEIIKTKGIADIVNMSIEDKVFGETLELAHKDNFAYLGELNLEVVKNE